MSKLQNVKVVKRPIPLVSDGKTQGETTPAVNDAQFELELCWCVHQLEHALSNTSQKVYKDTVKNLKILKSKTAPIIKKRQIMKAVFGDYRAKMQAEEKKMALVTKQIKFTTATDVIEKSSFVKKSAILNSGKDFRFNFKTASDESQSDNQNHTTMPTVTPSTAAFISEDFKSDSGSEFRFNFDIDDIYTDFNVNGVSVNEGAIS